jgi:hypothetical protein
MRSTFPTLTPPRPPARTTPSGSAARRARTVALLAVLAAAACGDTPEAPRPAAVARVEITAPPATLLVGESRRLAATPRAADDRPLADRPVTWASEAEAIAAVSADGVLTARAPGDVWITAASEGRQARARLRVVAHAPTLTAIAPNAITAGAAEPVVLRVTGAGFVPNSVVRWDGADRATTFVGPTELHAALAAADVAAPASVSVTVHTPAPGGGTSAPQTLRVEAAPAPAPTIAALAPRTIAAGAATPVTLTITGDGFTPRTRVTWDGAPRETQVVGAGELRITVPPADVAEAGPRRVAVVTDAPGGGQAEAVLTVVAPPAPAPPARVTVHSPWGSEWTWPGVALPLDATAYDALGRALDDRTARWATGSEAVAVLHGRGARATLVYGGAVGQTWVEATVDGVSTRRTVRVREAPAFDLVFAAGAGDDRHLAVWSPVVPEPPRRLRLPVVAFDPSPSPDGRLIAFAGAPAGAGPGANVDLYVVARDGSGLRRLTTDAAYDGAPAWSPDGSRIAFESNRGGSLDVWVMNADGGDPRRLTEARPADPPAGSGHAAGAPAWSPDGTQLAYTAGTNARSALWVMGADGGGKRPLTGDASASDYLPDWTPDGEYVAFRRVLRPSGHVQLLYVGARTGTVATRWTDLGFAGMLAHAPDGRWLAFSEPFSAAAAPLRVMPLDGSGARIVVPVELGGAQTARWIRRQ